MDKLIMIGALGAGFYFYQQQNQQSGTNSDDNGQVDITSGGTHVFQKIDRTFAYTLLLTAHSNVSDFDNLTDADLEQLLRAINIDPDVLKTHMTQEQADFLMNSAKEASKLRVNIVIDQEKKKQYNTLIRSHKKADVDQWVAQRQVEIDSKYSEGNNPDNPLIDILDRDFETYLVHINPMYMLDLRHCPKQDVFDYINSYGITITPVITNKINHLWDERITAEGTLYPRWVVDDILLPLATFIRKNWEKQKQGALDLVVVQKAGKYAIIDSTWATDTTKKPVP